MYFYAVPAAETRSEQEENMDTQSKTGKTKNRKLLRIILAVLLGICLAVFGVSLYMIISYYHNANEEQSVIDDLKEIARAASESAAAEGESAEEAATLPGGEGKGSGAVKGDASDDGSGSGTGSDFVSQYAVFHDINPDYIGWLYMEGTLIDYPVMYSPDDPEYYSRRTIYGVDSRGGTPFIGPGATIDDDCFYIYGHNMSSGLFFGTLNYYMEEDFGLSHPTFTFETLTERRTYEIFAVLKTMVYYSGFRYYAYGGSLSEDEFDELVTNSLEQSMYDFGVRPEYGEQILILSTCSYHISTGRFAVLARRIE